MIGQTRTDDAGRYRFDKVDGARMRNESSGEWDLYVGVCVGSVRGVEVIDRIRNNENREKNLEVLDELCETMAEGSLCAMGGLTPFPVRSAVKYFPEDFEGENRGLNDV